MRAKVIIKQYNNERCYAIELSKIGKHHGSATLNLSEREYNKLLFYHLKAPPESSKLHGRIKNFLQNVCDKISKERAKPKYNVKGYYRIGVFNTQEVLPFVSKISKTKKYMGHDVYMNSLRYLTFVEKGLSCVECGITGKYFALERNGGNFHFNLYGIRDGGEVLMTKDHIVPKSKKGKNGLNNLQPMCTTCNHKKDNKIEPI